MNWVHETVKFEEEFGWNGRQAGRYYYGVVEGTWKV